VTGAVIKYDPPIPKLDGMTQEEKDRALERFMHETKRQVNLIAENIEKRLKEMEK
jgi:hypothetical protein